MSSVLFVCAELKKSNNHRLPNNKSSDRIWRKLQYMNELYYSSLAWWGHWKYTSYCICMKHFTNSLFAMHVFQWHGHWKTSLLKAKAVLLVKLQPGTNMLWIKYVLIPLQQFPSKAVIFLSQSRENINCRSRARRWNDLPGQIMCIYVIFLSLWEFNLKNIWLQPIGNGAAKENHITGREDERSRIEQQCQPYAKDVNH